ncbi:MAG: rod shape-determining protein MreC [Candidatus Paceibacterota bacterium]
MGSLSHQEIEKLEMENQSLKSEIENLKNSILSNRGEALTAQVYSRYPFDGSKNIVINIGESDGVEVGMAVLTKENFLIGNIVNASNHSSEVETIFNIDWRKSVVIEERENQALLVGGNTPIVDLIPKDELINIGDRVLSISPDFPLNTLIGTVKEIENDPNEPWIRAQVNVPYDLKNIQEVIVLIQFP